MIRSHTSAALVCALWLINLNLFLFISIYLWFCSFEIALGFCYGFNTWDQVWMLFFCNIYGFGVCMWFGFPLFLCSFAAKSLCTFTPQKVYAVICFMFRCLQNSIVRFNGVIFNPLKTTWRYTELGVCHIHACDPLLGDGWQTLPQNCIQPFELL